MKNTLMVATLASALFGCSLQASAQYLWTPAQIQSLTDVTTGFHGGALSQLSTINSITPIPGGVELDITFMRGDTDQSDPFNPPPNQGLDFARVSLSAGVGDIDISAFSGASIEVDSNVNVTVQSFIQSDHTEVADEDGDGTNGESFSFHFWESNSDAVAGVPGTALFDFAAANEFDGNWNLPSPGPFQGAANVRQFGYQLAMFGLDESFIGVPIEATIRLTNVPEPTSLVLAGLAAIGLAGRRVRK